MKVSEATIKQQAVKITQQAAVMSRLEKQVSILATVAYCKIMLYKHILKLYRQKENMNSRDTLE